MNKWYWVVPFSFALFSVLYGILLGIRQCKDFKCTTDAYFSVVILSSIGFLVSLIFGIQAHNVVDEESELEKEIRLLEKQKKIAELKKEIKDIEAVELSTSKNIIANTS
ncbi:hypothetical protein F8M41_022378 [Gigaspora margarita]|uniref:Uncharacterized protein n=1 Tax=Gigaspora margarita TaxID=4874 RepID=A0A8H4ETT4_GIGMA|nr:hypothetical protein F8M41_022378 [Gigaspora margarita]